MTVFGIFTTSRAEFGLLSNLVHAIIEDQDSDYLLFAGGGHHLPSQGKSIQEIEDFGFKSINFDFFLSSDNEKSLTQSLGIELFQLSELFAFYAFDYVIVLGDRIELLPIVQAGIIHRKPIVHIHGGEITEGAIDDQIRHMITKASHVHFCAADEYKNNIVKMGEEESRVHCVGALGVDSIVRSNTIPKDKLFKKLSLDPDKPTVLLTYHPVTLELDISSSEQIMSVFNALEPFKFQLLITAPNVDSSHQSLFDSIQTEVSRHPEYTFINSLGNVNYQSMLRYVEFVIGNSSSGLLEVPYFKIPTINIGDRQKGRIQHRSIINTDYSEASIRKGIVKAIEPAFRESLYQMKYKFGKGDSAKRIVQIMKSITIDQKLMRKTMGS